MHNALQRLFSFGVLLVLCGVSLFDANVARAESPPNKVVVLKVDGIISPASSDFVIRGLTQAADEHAGLVVIELDTPGGLDTSMRSIIKQILASPVPVATFVSPGGARAASAGTFILYASHIAAMTPASNVGAASPVSVLTGKGEPTAAAPTASDKGKAPINGKEQASTDHDESNALAGGGAKSEPAAPESLGSWFDRLRASGKPDSANRSSDTMTNKITNDAVAYIRSLAQLRGRNSDFAEKAVRDAASMSAQDALQAHVIDLIANNLDDLLTKVNGREIKLDSGNTVRLATVGASIERIEPGWRSQLLGVIANPQVAVILLMVGILGLFFELSNPGLALPGVVGLICLLLGLYAFQMLPVNWAGVGLIIVGAALMVAEAFLPSFGVIGIGGVIAFVLGGLFLTDTGVPGFDLSIPFLIGIAVVSLVLLFIVATMAVRAHKHRVVSGREEMLGLEGVVTMVSPNLAYAHVRGESWRIRSRDPVAVGDTVRVTEMNGLTLQVTLVAGNNDISSSLGVHHVL